MAYDGKLKFDTGIDTKGFESDVAELTKLGAGAVAAVGAAMTGLGAASIKVGSDFEASMSQVAAVSGATATELTALTEKAREMGATTKFTAAQAAEALNYMAMAGWKSEQMISGLPGIMNLAAASGESLAAVSDIVTDAMTAFGMSAEESGRFADVLAKASSNANTNVAMMGATFKYVAPIAGSLGYSIEDTAAAIGLLANAGIKGEMAGTSLRAMLSRLVKPPTEAAEALKALGISATNADGSIKPLSQTVTELRKAFDGLSASQKAEYASTIAGTEAMSGLLSIVNASEADFNKLTMAVNSADGAAAGMAETMQDNLHGKLTILQSGLEAVGITAYEKFEKPLKGAVTSATEEVEKLNQSIDDGELSESVDKIADGFASLTEEVVKFTTGSAIPAAIDAFEWIADNGTTVKTVLGAVAGAYISYKAATIAATAAQAGFNAVAALNPVTATIGIATVIGASATAMMAYGSSVMKSKNALSGQALEINKQTQALKEQQNAYRGTIAAAEAKRDEDLAEIGNVERLWNELQNYVDSSGKVISNKERVLQITDQINAVMPDTIKWQNGEMQAYKETSAAIDDYLLKKRAQIILESKQAGYSEAVTNLPDLEKQLSELETENEEVNDHYNALLDERSRMFDEIRAKFMDENGLGLSFDDATAAAYNDIKAGLAWDDKETAARWDSIEEELSTYTDFRNQRILLQQQLEGMIKDSYLNIAEYEDTYTKVTSGNAEAMQEVCNGISNSIKAVNAQSRADLEAQAEEAKATLDRTKDYLADGVAGITEATVAAKQAAYDSARRQIEEWDLNTLKGRTPGSGDWEFLSGLKPVLESDLKEINTIVDNAGSTLISTADEIGADAGKSLVDSYLNQFSGLIAASEAEWSRLQRQVDSFASHMADVDLFQVEDDTLYITDLGDKISELKEYRETLLRLQEAGASKEFMSNFAQLDTAQAISYAEALFSGDIAAYFADWEETQRLSKEISEEFYAEQIDSVKTNFTDKLAEQMGQMPDIASQMGKDTAESFVEGFNAQMSEAQLLFAKMQAAVSAEQVKMRSAVGANGIPTVTSGTRPVVTESESALNINVTLELDGEPIAKKTIEIINEDNYTGGRSVIR